jgi:hypothetical protein
MKRKHRKGFVRLVVVFCAVATMLACSGCGIVSLLGTPTRHERKIPAEYDLTKHGDEKILVLVEQPAWLGAEANLRYELTKGLSHRLKDRIGIDGEHLVSYDKLSRFRSSQPNFSVLSAPQIGTALKADLVLYVLIESYEMRNMDHTNLYSGSLNVRAALYESAAGERLWPQSTGGKSIPVGFDVETGDRDAAVARLAAASAHCTVRHLYDCPEDEFGIFEDRSSVSW